MRFSFPCSNCLSSSSSSSSGLTNHINKRGKKILENVNAFAYEELSAATNGFRSSNKIGEGGFGTVYKGKLEDGRVVAVKVLSVESRQGEREFMSEISSLSNIYHENLVKLHGGCADGPCRFLVYDYMPNNSLSHTFLGKEKNRANFSWKMRREISIGIGRGFAYIREGVKPHIVHRDIKASNILLDFDFTPKLSDFGLSKLISDNASHVSTRVAGTLGYLAPEYAVSGHLTRKSDVYSFGVLLLEIVTGTSPIDFNLQHGEHNLPQKAWKNFKEGKLVDLVDPMLKGNFSEDEAVRFLKVGLLCVQERIGLRPRMSIAVKMMTAEVDINGQDISEPGLISNYMDVRIGQNNPSQSMLPSSSMVVSPSPGVASSSSIYESSTWKIEEQKKTYKLKNI